MVEIVYKYIRGRVCGIYNNYIIYDNIQAQAKPKTQRTSIWKLSPLESTNQKGECVAKLALVSTCV